MATRSRVITPRGAKLLMLLGLLSKLENRIISLLVLVQSEK